MSIASPLIHIGYHKTGTTFLQEQVFACAATGFVQPWSYEQVMDAFVRVHPLTFDVEDVCERFQPGLTEALDSDRVPVMSFERLSGNPHSGGYDSRDIADRLIAVFPDSRVLIVIRKQAPMLVSTYKQYIRVGGAASMRHYFEPDFPPPRAPGFSFAHFEFHRLIEHYQSQIGAPNVCVLPLEMLRDEMDAFVEKVIAFAGASLPEAIGGASRNVALGGLTLAVKRQVNRIMGRDSLNPGAPFRLPQANGLFTTIDRFVPAVLSAPFDRRLKNRVDAITGGRFCESNRRTAEITGLDLERYGYEVS